MQEGLRISILTVEDEPAVAEMVGLLLGGPNAKIVQARDGWMALEDWCRPGTLRPCYHRSPNAADERTRSGAPAAGARVRRQNHGPFGSSESGEHPGLRGITSGHDVRKTLRLRGVATRDRASYKKAFAICRRARRVVFQSHAFPASRLALFHYALSSLLVRLAPQQQPSLNLQLSAAPALRILSDQF